MTTALKVHPVADLFPMLAGDDLADLAVDIGTRGLLHPIVLDGEGRILDGRNRYAACTLAEVEPTFVTYDGDDPDGYALAVNIARRHLTKGQQAMIAARALFVSNSDQHSVANSVGVSQARIALAVTVRDHAPDLVDAVIAGALGLDAAYATARERKTAADSVEAQLARLREEDAELADMVVEGQLTLPGAWAERAARRATETRELETARRIAETLVSDFQSHVTSIAIGAAVATKTGEPQLITKEMCVELRRALDVMEGLL